MKNTILFILVAFTGKLFAHTQDTTKFHQFTEFFSGKWNSVQEACVGIGEATRIYELILGGHYLHVSNEAYFPKEGEGAAPETHEDWGFVSYDQFRETLVIREFNSEGFAITYVLQEITGEEAKQYHFLSEHIENAPPSLRARLTISILGEDSFEELFEMASGDKPFKVYVKSRWARGE